MSFKGKILFYMCILNNMMILMTQQKNCKARNIQRRISSCQSIYMICMFMLKANG